MTYITICYPTAGTTRRKMIERHCKKLYSRIDWINPPDQSYIHRSGWENGRGYVIVAANGNGPKLKTGALPFKYSASYGNIAQSFRAAMETPHHV